MSATIKNHHEDSQGMKEGWHLDKKVPLSIIIALMLQTAALVMWGAKLDMRVGAVESKAADQQVVIEAMRGSQTSLKVSLTRIEERQENSLETLKEIKSALNDRKSKP